MFGKDWNFWQQVVRYVMAYGGSFLVAAGFPEDMVKVAVGGAVAAVGLIWWWWKFSDAVPVDGTVLVEVEEDGDGNVVSVDIAEE